MAKKSTQSDETLPPPSLVQPRAVACEKIQAQIDKGVQIRAQSNSVRSKDDLDKVEAERSKWSKYNSELLTRLFDNTSITQEYTQFFGAFVPLNPTLPRLVEDFRASMDDKITRLEAIRDRLDLIPEISGIEKQVASSRRLGQDVFVVHGHDEAAKESVSRFIEKLGLRVIVLHEQPNAGRTIIEKFEAYTDVGFAVILLTPDDVGAVRIKATEMKPRARQNVIFELGYFIGKLGRHKVCALFKEGVEVPSDFSGVLYTQMDDGGAWRLALGREMKQAGLAVDLNKAM